MAIKKVRATQVTCDSCGDTQVVTDSLEIVGFSGIVSQQGAFGGTGGVKFFACVAGCLQRAIESAIEKSYGNRDEED